MATSPTTTLTPITPPRVAMVDPRTGLISREWYMFFLSLFRTAEGVVDADTIAPTTTSMLASLEAAVDRVEQEAQLRPTSITEQIRPSLDDLAQQIGTLPRLDQDVSARFILPSGVTPSASPYTYQNTNTYPVDVIVNGGTVSAIAFSRDNATFYTVGQINGVFALSHYDFLRVTYTMVPTMTLVPR